ncbi:MAG: DUF3016 domain-containing protein [Alteromonadaceae bacterium]|nr:DUF3016 domain-containing protein [Alteromonadaceae bacterium]
MIKKLSILITLLLMCNSYTSIAAEVEVTWSNPEKYRDIRASSESRKHFRAKVFRNLEKHFTKLAAKLPENQTLKIKVSDLDLAGDTLHGGISRIRIVKEINYPRIKFSYQLLDKENKTVLLAGDVNLKDMNFMQGASLRYKSDYLGYEKKMIDKWFFKSFKSNLNKN